MKLTLDNVTIRNADVRDVELLCAWWANGTVMAHAGFPNGLATDKDALKERIINQKNKIDRQLFVIEENNYRVGELNYRKTDEFEYEIGIKVCDFNLHSKGIGTKALTLLISYLYEKLHAKRIHLDTNLNNVGAQKFYERLGFKKYDTKIDVWKDQVGEMQSVVYYELDKESFTK